jgi:uncharacterized coiled-coil DUF342 family protein
MEKEYVYISKDLAERIKTMEDFKLENEDISKIFADFKFEVENYTESIEDAVASFRRQSKKLKEGFKEVIEQECEGLNQLWEEMDSKRYEISKKVKEVRETVNDSRNDIKELKSSIDGLSIYGLSSFIELVEKINYMNDSDKELLARMFDYKRAKK